MCSSQLIATVTSSDGVIVEGLVINGGIKAASREDLDGTETDKE